MAGYGLSFKQPARLHYNGSKREVLLSDGQTDSVGFRVPQTLERFELWGAHEGLFLPSLPTQRFHGLARRTQRT